MRADRDQSCDQTEDSAPERLGSRGRRESLERARCSAANRSQPYREAVSFNALYVTPIGKAVKRRMGGIFVLLDNRHGLWHCSIIMR